MSESKRRRFRLNARAALILGVGLLVAASGFAALSYVRGRQEQPALLRQALQQAKAKPPKYDLALLYLNEYLTSHPGDPVALESKANILSEIASNADQLGEAIKLAEAAIRIDPDAPRNQALRKQVVEMDLRMGQFRTPENLRIHTAENTVRELIDKGDRGAETLRLLAKVLEVQALLGDPKALGKAAAAYEEARKLEPANIEGTERLAQIYRDPKGLDRPQDADKILDEMLAANRDAERRAKTPEARRKADDDLAQAYLARYRHFARAARDTRSPESRRTLLVRASEDLRLALTKAPEDFRILLAAAESELQRGDVAKARDYFDRIPADPEQRRSDAERMQLRIVQGMIDLGENRPDEAIESWREGLVATGGTNADLTWRLAQIELDLGRLKEAEPLIQQHRRLTGGSEPTAEHRYLEGTKLFYENQPRKAIEVFNKALPQINPILVPRLRYMLGQCYEKVQDPSSALQQYTLAAAEDPKWSPPRLSKVRLLQATRPLDAAQEVALVEAELQDDPMTVGTGARLALQRELAKPPAARSWDDVNRRIEHLKAVSPAAKEVALLQADVLLNTDRLGDAAALLEQAARRDKHEADLWIGWALILTRQNKVAEALRVLEQAAAPDAVGDAASLRIARARLLTQIGNGKEARDALIRGEEALKPTDRPLVWAELGNMLRQRHEDDEARKAFEKYAELLPDDPRPQLLLVSQALAVGDRDGAAKALEALKKITGANGLYYRVALAQDLLRETPEGKSEDKAARSARYAEAEKLIDAIEQVAPQERYAYLLRGLLHERRAEPTQAIAAYERALLHGGGQETVARLVPLYTSEGRFEDIKALRDTQAGNATLIAELGAQEAFRLGNKEAAEELAEELVAGNPEDLDVRKWQARMLRNLGKPEEAEKTLRDHISRHSEEWAPWLSLFVFQIDLKQTDAALATVEQMKRNVKPGPNDLPEFVYAQCYRAAGATAEAEAAYQQALEKWPTNPNVVRAVFALKESTNRSEEAEKVLRDYIALAPDQRWAVRGLAMLLADHPKDSQSWQQAWDLVKDVPASGDAPEERLIRALVLLRHPDAAAKYDEIEAILKQLLDDIPADRPAAVTARNLLTNLYLKQGKKDEARRLVAIGAADLSNPRALAVYVENLIRDGKLDDAAAQLKRLTALAPDDILTLKLRAYLLDAQKKRGEALTLLDRAFHERIDSAGGEVACRDIVAMFGSLEGPAPIDDPKAGLPLAEELAKRWPGSSWVLARISRRQGDVPDARTLELCKTAVENGAGVDLLEAAKIAIGLAEKPDAGDEVKAQVDAILKEALRREPANLDLLLATASLHYTQGRFEDAVKAYRTAQDARPTNPGFLNNLAWILSEDLNQPEEGLKAINELFGRVPAQPEFLDTRASIYARLGRTPEAIADWKKAVAARPGDASYAYRLARAYLKEGDEANFRTWMDAARKNNLSPDDVQPSERAELKALMAR